MDSRSKNYHSKTTRLTNALLRDLAERKFDSGKFLPSEAALAEHYRASRYSIRRTIDNLIASGALSRHDNRRIHINHDRLTFADAPPRKNFVMAWCYAAEPDTMIADVTEGIRKYADQRGLQLHMINSVDSHEPMLSSLGQCASLGVDGAVVFPYVMPEYVEALSRLAESGVSLVTIGPLGGVTASSVCGDDYSGAFAAIRRLLERHNLPAYYLGARETTAADMRCRAFARAMCEAGLAADLEKNTLILPPIDKDPANWPMPAKWAAPGKAIEDHVIDRIETPACVMCENDYFAYGLYQAAARRGLVIGRDLFVTGFDDLPVARRMQPPLSSVRVDSVEIGYQAARVLHQTMSGEITEPVHLKIPSEYVERESN